MFRFLNRLAVAQKLALISLFFILPNSLMLVLMVSNINENIRFTELEKIGNAYQRPLMELLEAISKHQLLLVRYHDEISRKKSPPKTIVEQIALIETQVDQAFDRLEKINEQYGDDLQFTEEGLKKRSRSHFRVSTVRDEWNSQKLRFLQVRRDLCNQQHLHLIADIREMITHAGDTSNLILDPDLDSYYLMDVTLLALPETQDRLTEMMIYGGGLLRHRASDRVQMSVYASLLQTVDLKRIGASLRTSLNEDVNFYGKSETFQKNILLPLQEYEEANNSFADQVIVVAFGDVIVAEEDFLAEGNRAFESSFKLWRVASEELDVLLQTRIEYYQKKKISALVLTVFALVAAVGFVSFVTRSISGPLQKQAEDLKNANAALEADIVRRRQIEEALKSSEQFYHTLVETLPQSIFRKDVQGRYVFVNRLFSRLLKKPTSEILGKRDVDLFPEEQAKRYLAEDEKLLASGGVLNGEEEFRQDDGEILHMQVIKIAMSGDGAQTQGIQGILLDITARKRSEAELERAHRELVDASRVSGMAEIATGVLHNVGNVLNSVCVATGVLMESIQKSKIPSVAKVSALLREHEHDLGNFMTSDNRGKQLPGYLETLTEHLSGEQEKLLKELTGLKKNVDHIKDIIALQQSYAHASGLVEVLSISSLIDDAIAMHADALSRHEVKIVREYDSIPPFKIDKHKTLQILVNLISNAKYACSDSDGDDKRTVIRLERHQENLVRIRVIDNGMGIKAENLDRIFEHGFTTKKDGHGFGLHSSAIAAVGMNGSLRVLSEGLGKGAEFVLEIPYQT